MTKATIALIILVILSILLHLSNMVSYQDCGYSDQIMHNQQIINKNIEENGDNMVEVNKNLIAFSEYEQKSDKLILSRIETTALARCNIEKGKK